MVEIIKEKPKEPSFMDKLGRGANQLLGSYLQQQQQQQETGKIDEAIQRLTGRDVSGLTPDMKSKFMEQFGQGEIQSQAYLDKLKQSEQEYAWQAKNQQALEEFKQQGKKQQQQEKLDYLSQLFGNQNTRGQQPTEQMQQGLSNQMQGQQPNQMEGFDASQLNDEQIAIANALDPNIGRALSHSKDVGLREKREEKKEVSESYKENQKYLDKVRDGYENFIEKDAKLERMKQLEDQGQLSESGIINFLRQMGLRDEWLQNPANEEYSKLALDLLGGGTLQADYGSRILASEFKVSQQRIPSLSQTPEGRRQIRENIEMTLLPAKLKDERLQYYLDKAERTGKPLPHDLRGKILKDIKPKLEEVYDRFKQRNGRYKVKTGTPPDDNAIEKYYFISDGNLVKAKQMMKEDGYHVESEKSGNLSGGSSRAGNRSRK